MSDYSNSNLTMDLFVKFQNYISTKHFVFALFVILNHLHQSPSASSERTSNKDKKKKAAPITMDSFFDSDTEDAKDYSSPRVASAKKSSDVRKITFDMEPEIHKIHIKDYPEGMPKRIDRDPNKPYVFRKIEDLTDDRSKSDSTLGQTRARAKAIIMEKDGVEESRSEKRKS